MQLLYVTLRLRFSFRRIADTVQETICPLLKVRAVPVTDTSQEARLSALIIITTIINFFLTRSQSDLKKRKKKKEKKRKAESDRANEGGKSFSFSYVMWHFFNILGKLLALQWKL